MIKIFKFRVNDLSSSLGKQIEFNSAVVKEFFKFTKEEESIICHCKDADNNSIQVHSTLKLSPARGDYKEYQNQDGKPNIKDYFLKILRLTDSNKDDYFALKSRGDNQYDLYFLSRRSTLEDLYDKLSISRDYLCINTPNSVVNDSNISHSYKNILTAIRTKPFLLLAGISGTGKSRIVREFAFKSCPSCLQDKDETTPGNYCMIEVKPNWHDSTELIGYYSNLSKSYQFKKFVNFLIKAKMYPDVPFFVCLDEMNLAPVEQYFAEMLSILETRKHVSGNADIKTGVIVEAKYFKELCSIGNATNVSTSEHDTHQLKDKDKDIYFKLFGIEPDDSISEEVGSKTDLTTEGLTLPSNVIIVGTVNMDDTTHQFSRKVIDRAMTIEMNGGRLADMFGGSKNLAYLQDEEQQKWQYSFSQRYVNADEVLEAHPGEANKLKEILPQRLEEINKVLKGTPFEVSYRVLNELTIMVGVMLDDNENNEDVDTIISKAVNNILLMKILPRIEGDVDMFKKDGETKNRLELLRDIAPIIKPAKVDSKEADEDQEEAVSDEQTKVINSQTETEEEQTQTARGKLKEMIERLNTNEFTRFWP